MGTIHCSDSREIILRNKRLRDLEKQLAQIRRKLQDLYRRADSETVGLVIKTGEQNVRVLELKIAQVNTEIDQIRAQNRSNHLGQSTLVF